MEFTNRDFLDDSFDLKAWTNQVLQQCLEQQQQQPPSSIGATENKEQHSEHSVFVENNVSSMVMKLQLLFAEQNQDLRDYSIKALNAIPSSIRSIDKVRREALGLQAQLSRYDNDLGQIESKAGQSLELLSSLDRVKTSMEQCTEILTHAEKLSKLTTQIESDFASNDLLQAATTINNMQLSLNILKDVPQFKDHKKQLMLLEDRLEGMARPQLLHCFSHRDTEATRSLINIFQKMNRTNQLLQYYYRSRFVPIEQKWEEFKANKENATGDAFVRWLPSFYDAVAEILQEERRWASQVFPASDKEVLASLAIYALNSLESSFVKRITDVLNAMQQQEESHPSPKSPLFLVVSLLTITTNFYRTLQPLLHLTTDVSQRGKVERAVFHAYVPFQRDYASWESKFLQSHLKALQLEASDFGGTLQRIDDSLSEVFYVAEGVVDSCIALTQGCESEALVKILSTFFEAFLSRLLALLQSLRVAAKLDIGSSSSASSSTSSSSLSWSSGSTEPIQAALQLLLMTSTLDQKLHEFENTLRSRLCSQRSALFGSGWNSETGDLSKTALCIQLQDDVEKAQRLFRYLKALEDVTFKLLAGPAQLLNSFNSGAQSFAYDTMFLLIKEQLMPLPTMPIWNKETVAASTEKATHSVELPSFSKQPQSYITQIGHHLLDTLPQQLEPFANEVSQHTEVDDEAEDDFGAHWITTVGRGMMSLYVQRIMEIPTLSSEGCAQLTEDIRYACKILNAWGITPLQTLSTIQKLLETSPDKFEEVSKQCVDEERASLEEEEGGSEASSHPISTLCSMIAKKRGLLHQPQPQSTDAKQ